MEMGKFCFTGFRGQAPSKHLPEHFVSPGLDRKHSAADERKKRTICLRSRIIIHTKLVAGDRRHTKPCKWSADVSSWQHKMIDDMSKQLLTYRSVL